MKKSPPDFCGGGACLVGAVSTVGYGVYSARDTQDLVSTRVSGQVKDSTLASLKGVAGTQAGTIQASSTWPSTPPAPWRMSSNWASRTTG